MAVYLRLHIFAAQINSACPGLDSITKLSVHDGGEGTALRGISGADVNSHEWWQHNKLIMKNNSLVSPSCATVCWPLNI